MKHITRDYAVALADLMGKSKLSDDSLVANFFTLLKKNGELKNARKIIDLAQKHYLSARGNKKVILQTAREIGAEDMISNFVKKGDLIKKEINPAIVAGVKIIIDDQKQMDFSLQKKLEQIFR